MGLFRKMLDTLSGLEATEKAILTTYERTDGQPEPERLYRLFADRGGWRDLPEPFLRALASRLKKPEKIINFIWLSERHELDQNQYRAACSMEPAMAMQAIASCLCSVGTAELQNPEAAEEYYKIAHDVDPKWAFAPAMQAVLRFAREDWFAAALLLDGAVPGLERLAEKGGAYDVDIDQLLTECRRMQKECQQKIDADDKDFIKMIRQYGKDVIADQEGGDS